MSVTVRPEPRQPASSRLGFLNRLAAEVRARGGRALIALADEDYPVLYVRSCGRTIAVVAMCGADGTWWYVWGRSASVRGDRHEAAADYLSAPYARAA